MNAVTFSYLKNNRKNFDYYVIVSNYEIKEVIYMSKICEVCGKKPVAGRSVSHSHKVSNRTFAPNIQRVTIKETSGKVRKANVCTQCLKAGKVTKA